MTSKKDPNKTPQELVSEFWDGFFSRKPGKVTSIFPRALYATLLPASQPRGLSTARNAAESYEAAARECREKVRRIVRECARTNEKFTDPDFDVETDPERNCLNGLVRDIPVVDNNNPAASTGRPAPATSVSAAQLRSSLNTLVNSRVLASGVPLPLDVDAVRGLIAEHDAPAPPAQMDVPGRRSRNWTANSSSGGGVESSETYSPGSIHRVDWIFDSPQFTVDGFSSSDIKQGSNGDCWWLAAVATIAHRRDVMDRVCVARDEECGVYGFVFQRDGEWISVVIDDSLYLTSQDFDFYSDQYDATGRRAREHRRKYQTGSDALYFAKCADQNETWLPLLEKAYAKAHGDYEAISGGWSGEAVEDMTGGVTTTVATNRVLRKDKLWRELANSDGEFVFALSAIGTGWDWQKGGLALGHAYSILKAREEVDEDGNKVRLVQIRNPWGERSSNGVGEWNGPWSDGSKEWTPYWLKKLNHRFGDDGIFWMSYNDMLETFLFLHRTRLFDERWTVVQQWTSMNVGWVSGYLNTKFLVEIKKAGMVVFVLTQLDERHFRGFEGQYEFALHFVLQEENSVAGDHICRVRPVHKWENRSVSCEVELEPGRYEVLPKITAVRDTSRPMVEDVVKDWAERNPQKLRQVGMQYDLAHAKGGVPDEDELLVEKREKEKKKKEAEKRKRKAKEKREKAKSREFTLVVETKKSEPADDKDNAAENEGGDKKAETPLAKDEEKSEKKDDPDAESKKTDTAEEKPKDEKTDESKDNSETKSKDTDAAKGENKEGSEDEPANEQPADKSVSSSEGAPTPSSEDSNATKEEAKDEIKKDEKDEAKKDERKDEAKDDEKKDETKDDEKNDEANNEKKNENENENGENKDGENADAASESGSDSESSDSESEEEKPIVDNDGPNPPWNAVCVVGLRVYANDPAVTITLVKPKDAEEAASLAIDTVAAGATS